jgi:hypothetical protein
MGDPQRYFSKTKCPAISQKPNLSVEHLKNNSAHLDEDNRGLKN